MTTRRGHWRRSCRGSDLQARLRVLPRPIRITLALLPTRSAQSSASRRVALARTALAAWDLIAGRLVRPFDLELPVPFAYWIVCPKPSARLAKIAAFSDWLIAEASADARQLEQVKFNTNGRKAS